MIAIIDYDAGNLKSVEKAFAAIGEQAQITRDAQTIMSADHLVLPGVGAFAVAMEKLEEYDLKQWIIAYIKTGRPFLGICLGLQLLFEESEESPGVKGLSLLPGKIKRLPDAPGYKVPHMGWNSLEVKENQKLFQGIRQNPYVYFVHSYYLETKECYVAASTEYTAHIHASVEADNIFACQFHPEKSGDLGLMLLKNFAEIR